MHAPPPKKMKAKVPKKHHRKRPDEEEDKDEEVELEDPRKHKVIGKGGVYHGKKSFHKVGKPLCKFYFLIRGQLIWLHYCGLTYLPFIHFLRICDA